MFNQARWAVLLALLGAAPTLARETEGTPTPAPNMDLPKEVTFSALASRAGWLTAEDVEFGLSDMEANCSEGDKKGDNWSRGQRGEFGPLPEGDAVLKGIKSACEPSEEKGVQSDAKRIVRWEGKMPRTSARVVSTQAKGIVLRLELSLGDSGVSAQDIEWCYLPIVKDGNEYKAGGVAVEQLDNKFPEKCIKKSKGRSPRAELDADAVGIAYWVRFSSSDDQYETWGQRDLAGGTLHRVGDREQVARSAAFDLKQLTAGIDQSAILVGLTDFLLDRADVELRTWVMDSQVKELCATGATPPYQPGPGDFLPQTCDAVTGRGVQLLFSGASVLQATARADLSAFVRHLGEVYVREGNGAAAQLILRPSGGAAASSGLRAHDLAATAAVFGRALELSLSGERPEAALAGWAADGRWLNEAIPDHDRAERLWRDYPLTTYTYLASVALASLSFEDGRLALPPEDEAKTGLLHSLVVASWVNLKRDPAGKRLVAASEAAPDERVALLAAVAEGVLFSKALPMLHEQLEVILDLRRDALLYQGPETADAMRQEMLAHYAEAVRLSLELGQDGIGAAARYYEDELSEQMGAALRDAERFLGELSGVAGHVAGARYGLAISGGLGMASRWGLAKAEDPSAQQMLRGLGFAASLAESTSPEAAKQTIEAWAAPAGSYMRKHDGVGWYAGLNGYVGAGGGREWVVNLDDQALSEPALQFAPMVQIGVDVGMRWGKSRYAGAYLSLIDLGAVATWRVGNPEGETEGGEAVEIAPPSALHLQQVVAPGFYLVAAPWRAPFALGVGASVAPALREITVDGTPLERDLNIVRLGLFIGLDLPLLP